MQTAPHAPIPYRAILPLSLAAFASGLSLRVTDALLPRLASDFALTLGQASLAITFFSVAYGLSQLMFGPLGDRFGKYLVIGWACVACTVATLFCALAPNFDLLLLARFLAGATAAAIIPLSMAWIGDVVPYERRQPVLARFLIGQILGLSAGVLAGGLAADHGNWRLPFFGVALVLVPICASLFMLNRRLPPEAKVTRPAEGSALRRMISEFRQVLEKPWARVVLWSVFTEGACLFGALAFIVVHLHKVHGIALSIAGSMVMLFGFGGLLFAMASSVLVKRLGEVGLARWGGILIAGSYLAIAFAPVWWWAVPGCFIAGLGFYMLHNTLQINATQMAPERRGAAVASFASCFYFGQSVGVGLAGALVVWAGTATVIAVGAFGVLGVSICFSRLRASRDH